jgi:hypothetical protein
VKTLKSPELGTKHERNRAFDVEIVKLKGTGRLAEIRDGWTGGRSGIDSAFLAGELYREPDGNALPVWDIRDQCDGFLPNRLCVCIAHGKIDLESELAISDSNRVRRGLHDFLQL